MRHRAIINPDTPSDVIAGLKRLDLEPVAVPRCSSVAPPLAGHPDIQLFIHGRRLFCRPDMPMEFAERLESSLEIVRCETGLGGEYPLDIAYNVACAAECAFHRLSHTDPAITQHLMQSGVRLVDVKQGYSRCSTLIVRGDNAVTADRGIHNAACGQGMASLLISPGHISLPGYRYGFIGGGACAFGDLVLFTGSLESHPDRNAIYDHVEKSGSRVHLLSRNEIIDLGGIFIIDSL